MALVTGADLRDVWAIKYGDLARCGWGPRMRWRFRHFTPDEHYEASLMALVANGCAWLDVGCGRHIFPSNPRLARLLVQRARRVVGVDPDPTLDENELVHERVRASMEDFHGEGAFDLVSMRMVAEHVTDPDRFAASVARALKRDGRAVVYTVYGYSPVPLITRLIPFRLHNPVKRLFWGTQPKDSFPTAFRMNTRTALRELFGRHDMAEEAFMYLDDCRSLSGFRAGHWTELALWRTLSALGLPYPERCLLGVYKKG